MRQVLNGVVLAGSDLIPRDKIMKSRYLTDEIYGIYISYSEPKPLFLQATQQYPNIVHCVPFDYDHKRS